mmetsp:Transcript_13457/g.50062  ORF Transcript_13457/g.50062 Transcript_13457/m.50062 type:complete len:228 (+) Transcript_13457:2288-2971(+)
MRRRLAAEPGRSRLSRLSTRSSGMTFCSSRLCFSRYCLARSSARFLAPLRTSREACATGLVLWLWARIGRLTLDSRSADPLLSRERLLRLRLPLPLDIRMTNWLDEAASSSASTSGGSKGDGGYRWLRTASSLGSSPSKIPRGFGKVSGSSSTSADGSDASASDESVHMAARVLQRPLKLAIPRRVSDTEWPRVTQTSPRASQRMCTGFRGEKSGGEVPLRQKSARK